MERLNYKQDNHMRYLIYINDNTIVNHDTKKNYFINSCQDNSHSILDHFVDGNFHTFLQLCAGPGESQTDLFRSVRFWSVICRSDFGVVGVPTSQQAEVPHTTWWTMHH